MLRAVSELLPRMRGTMMDMTKEESVRTGTLQLDGELYIRRASELKKILLQAQEGVDHLILNLEGVTGADVSGLQLLCALHRTAVKENKRLTVAGTPSPSFRQAVRGAGYERERGCPLDRDQSCLWKAGV
jgi:anti-anti-sigma factor